MEKIKFLSQKYKIIQQNEIVRNTVALISGSALATLIPILLSPILTRFYEPTKFGEFSAFMACCSLSGVFATARYDLAIIEPRKDEDARGLLQISIYLAAAYSALLLFGTLAIRKLYPSAIDRWVVGKWILLVPPSVFILASCASLTFWLNRQKQYSSMSKLRILNNGASATVSTVCGYYGVGSGLFVGLITGQAIALFLLFKRTRDVIWDFNFKSIAEIASCYRRYPQFLLPATLAGEIAHHVPILILSWGFGPIVAGYMALANRVAAGPLALLGASIGEVYRQKIFEEHHTGGNCRGLYIRMFSFLAIVGSIPALILFLFGPQIFSIGFGIEWEKAGQVASAISPMLFFNFTSTPLAFTIAINQSQKADMVLQIVRMVFSVLGIWFGYYNSNYMLGIYLYSATYSCYYMAHSFIQYRALFDLHNPLIISK